MRSIVLILVLALSALVSTGARAVALDHAETLMQVRMVVDSGHRCPKCPDNTSAQDMDHSACSDCAACGGFSALVPLAGTVSCPAVARGGEALHLRLFASRTDAHDPPPPRV